MSDPMPGLSTDVLPHAVFLRRLAAARERTAEARLGRAAFVTLRLVDLLQEAAPPAVAFHYQHGATERACQSLPAASTETAHLIGVVASAADAFHARDTRLLFPALFAYAHFLEDELRLEEALDVLDTLQRLTGEGLRAEDKVSARLRTARVLRKLNRFDEAEQRYDEAGELAAQIGDRHSQLLSRIGRAEATRGRGNLGEAEAALHGIIADMKGVEDDQVQAVARHVLAAVLHTGGRPAEALPHVWRAFALYDDDLSRTRALGDVGINLLALGDAVSAERAFREVLKHEASGDVRANALIELMNCASCRRDRVGFERWREECDARRASMAPNILVDFLLKLGIGRARFGQLARADALFSEALQIAERAGLHEFAFRIRRIKAGLSDCPLPLGPSAAETHEYERDAVREVSESLALLEP